MGDVVLAIDDGSPSTIYRRLNYRIATHNAGDAPSLKISTDGHMRDVAVKLTLPARYAAPDRADRRRTQSADGSASRKSSRRRRRSILQLAPTATGVADETVSPGRSIAANQGFQPGDIIRSVNGAAIRNVGDLNRALTQANGHWDMIIDRNGQRMTLSVDERQRRPG